MPPKYGPQHEKIVMMGHEMGWSTREIIDFWSGEGLHPRYVQRVIKKNTEVKKSNPKKRGRPRVGKPKDIEKLKRYPF